MDSKAIRTAGPQGQQGNRDSRTTSYSLQSNKHQEYTHTILCLTGDCHQLFSTSQQTSSAHSHHPVSVTVTSFSVQANKHHQHIHTTLCLWLSSASLYKPTNITSTFTPHCACGCHQLLCTRQQTSPAHSHHPVPVAVTSFSVQDNKHHQHIHTTLCLWLSPASLYKTTNITSTFTPPCACGCHQLLCTRQQTSPAHSHHHVPVAVTSFSVQDNKHHQHHPVPVTVTSFAVQANKHHQQHIHTILYLGGDCHQLFCTSQQTSSRTRSYHPVPWVDLSPATLYNYKPTNIIMNTFTPPCDCHEPFSTSQQMRQTLTSSCVFWASRVMILSCSLTSDSSL